MTKLMISNKEIIDIMKIFKSLKEFAFLIKGVIQAIKNRAKEQIGDSSVCYYVH